MQVSIPEFVNAYKITDSGLVLYSRSGNSVLDSSRNQNSLNNLERKYTSTELSKASIKKIKERASWLVKLAKIKKPLKLEYFLKNSYKVSFITLTLSAEQVHSDVEIKTKLLESFLLKARRFHGLNTYIWKAELQRNGNIHFHILTPSYIPFFKLKYLWNEVQQSLGYIDKFEAKHKHRNPPSVNIQQVSNTEQIKKYMAKYITKSTTSAEPEPTELNTKRCKQLESLLSVCGVEYSKKDIKPFIEGKKFGCSRDLVNVCDVSEFADSVATSEIKSMFDDDDISVIPLEKCIVLRFDWSKINALKYARIIADYYDSYKSNLAKYNGLMPQHQPPSTAPQHERFQVSNTSITPSKAKSLPAMQIHLAFDWLALPRY
jgi:hypothetical protein